MCRVLLLANIFNIDTYKNVKWFELLRNKLTTILNGLRLPGSADADLPDATTVSDGSNYTAIKFVSDYSEGPALAFSNGSTWNYLLDSAGSSTFSTDTLSPTGATSNDYGLLCRLTLNAQNDQADVKICITSNDVKNYAEFIISARQVAALNNDPECAINCVLLDNTDTDFTYLERISPDSLVAFYTISASESYIDVYFNNDFGDDLTWSYKFNYTNLVGTASLTKYNLSADTSATTIHGGAGFDVTSRLNGPGKQGSNIASATTINLNTATGDYIHVTGTTTITGITLSQGSVRTIVFDGALTLTNGSSLILPGSANITTAAGDIAVVRGEASGVVRCIQYTVAATAPGGASVTTGSFTGTLTGYSSNPTGTVNYRIVGNLCALWITSGITGTSNSSTMTMTGLPSAVQPTTRTIIPCSGIVDNSVSRIPGEVDISGSTATFYLHVDNIAYIIRGSNLFTASGSKGITTGWSVLYKLD